MDLKKDFRVEMKKYPTNLYRDDKMKTIIQDYIVKQQNAQLKTKLKKLDSSSDKFVAAVVSGSSSADLESTVSTPANYEFKHGGKTKVHEMINIIKEERGKEGLQ